MRSNPHRWYLYFASSSLQLLALMSIASAEPSEKTIDQVKRGTVSITTFDAGGKPLLQGGGFFVLPNRLVTNVHVLTGATLATVRTFDGHSYLVDGIVSLNQNNDLALIQISGSANISSLSLAANVESEGESVTLISALADTSWKVSSGITGNLWYIQGAGEYLRVTAAVRRGNSGSPIINDKGEVVGVAALHFEGQEELSFAVPGELVKELVNGHPELSSQLISLATAK